MKMKISPQVVKSARDTRAWSQEHLAEVCSLSLRTIQRIENTGVGSFETVRALAAGLEISISDLCEPKQGDKERRFWFTSTRIGFGTAVMAAMLVALLTTSASQAEPVFVKFDIELESLEHGRQPFGKARILAGSDTTSALGSDHLRLAFAGQPELWGEDGQDGTILVYAKIYRGNDGHYILDSEHQISTLANAPVEIILDDWPGGLLALYLTPSISE